MSALARLGLGRAWQGKGALIAGLPSKDRTQVTQNSLTVMVVVEPRGRIVAKCFTSGSTPSRERERLVEQSVQQVV